MRNNIMILIAIISFTSLSTIPQNTYAGTTPTITCPTATVSSASLAVIGDNTIQPGAYTQLQFGITIGLSGGSPAPWVACENGTIGQANPCYVYITQCPSFAPGPITPGLNPTATCSPGWDAVNGRSVCNLDTYNNGNEQPGFQNLCYTYAVQPYGGPLLPACPYQYITSSLAQPANYIVSQYFFPNIKSGQYLLANGAPLSLSVSPVSTVTKGQQISFGIQSDQHMPTFIELADPGTNIFCSYGGVPSTYGTSLDQVPICSSVAPFTSDLPCVISYSGIKGQPNNGDAPTVTITTANLAPGTYAVCGYEGFPPSAGQNPYPVFFTSNDFVVVCPVTGCNGYVGPPAGPPLSTSAVQAEICSLYYSINELLALLALTLTLIGAVVYGAGNVMPGSTKGVIQAYGMGLVIAGTVSLVMVGVSVYILSLAANIPVQQILALNGCVAP